MMPSNPHGLESEGWKWMDANLPVQAWKDEGGGAHFVVYMPRKETCFTGENMSDPDEIRKTAHDAAKLHRNLARLFDAFADGRIEYVYYPDKLVEEAEKEAHHAE